MQGCETQYVIKSYNKVGYISKYHFWRILMVRLNIEALAVAFGWNVQIKMINPDAGYKISPRGERFLQQQRNH